MITPEEIKDLASLARLEVSEAESKQLQHDLGAILDYVAELKGVPHAAEALRGQADGLENYNKLREDREPIPTLEKGEFVKVKKIL